MHGLLVVGCGKLPGFFYKYVRECVIFTEV